MLDRLSRYLLEEGEAEGRSLSSRSVHAYVRAANHCLSWATKEGEEVMRKASLPKLPKHQVEVLTRDEIRRMEETAKTERDKLIIRILADADLRVDELLGLRVGDLMEQSRNHLPHLRGNGAKDRMVPIPRDQPAAAHLRPAEPGARHTPPLACFSRTASHRRGSICR